MIKCLHNSVESESNQSSLWSSPPTSERFCIEPREEDCQVHFPSHGAGNYDIQRKNTCCKEEAPSVVNDENLITSTHHSQEGK